MANQNPQAMMIVVVVMMLVNVDDADDGNDDSEDNGPDPVLNCHVWDSLNSRLFCYSVRHVSSPTFGKERN